MFALVKTEQKREVTFQEVPLPVLSAGEALVKVEYCGVCGSDLHAYNHAPGYEFVQMPRILGHEISGTVVEVFDDRDKHLINRQVITESIQFCGNCETCRSGRTNICERFRCMGLHMDGGMAQFVKCETRFIQPIPEGLPSEIAALVEPLSIAVHAVDTIGNIRDGEKVWVQGPGTIGFFTGLVCRARGAEVVLSGLPMDWDARLRHASTFGMKPFVTGEMEVPADKVDVLFECSGSPKGVLSGLDRLKKGGRAVFVAMYEHDVTLAMTKAIRNEWKFSASYGCQPKDYQKAFVILQEYAKELEQIISLYPLQRGAAAFADALDKKVMKPILKI